MALISVFTLFVAADVLLTYRVLTWAKKYDLHASELNGLAKYVFGKLGLEWGSILLFLIAWLVVSIATSTSQTAYELFFGAYFMLIWHNLLVLLKLRKIVKTIRVVEECGIKPIDWTSPVLKTQPVPSAGGKSSSILKAGLSIGSWELGFNINAGKREAV